jgi:nitroimidazol reductase NimA-like FMN-containing flavoprotein (pyridoxamine 5'-phosphate oxidase superfamily)
VSTTDRAEEVLDETECLRLLGAGGIGRVAYTVGALPAVRPVRYTMQDDALVIPARAGGPFVIAVRGAILAFEADAYDGATRHGWSVTVVGRSHVAPSPGPRAPVGRAAADLCLIVVQARLITGLRSTLPAWEPGVADAEPIRS